LSFSAPISAFTFVHFISDANSVTTQKMALRWLLRYFLLGVVTLRSHGSGSLEPNFRMIEHRVKVKVLGSKNNAGGYPRQWASPAAGVVIFRS
jgi:hypothetical protein